jgi:hypothetical protein
VLIYCDARLLYRHIPSEHHHLFDRVLEDVVHVCVLMSMQVSVFVPSVTCFRFLLVRDPINHFICTYCEENTRR